MKDAKIAVVLVTFNRSHMLKENLLSLREQGDLTYFIIDNNSTDNTKEVVDSFNASTHHSVHYFNTHTNLGGAGGFAFGCRKALEDSSFTHLWLADDDVTFHSDCLSQLTPYLDQTSILQPMRYNLDGTNAEASSTNIDLSSIFILNHKRNSVMGTQFEKQLEPFDIQSVPFEGPLIPRAVFDCIGVPDERYFIFSDDLDFSIKSLRNGFSIKCVPMAKMTRLRPALPNHKPCDWKSYFVYRNFFRIHKMFGNNWFVKRRPYLLAFLVCGYCLIRGNIKGVFIVKDALKDGMSDAFTLNKRYIP